MTYTPPPPPEIPPNPNRPSAMPFTPEQYAQTEPPPVAYAPVDQAGYAPVYGYGAPPPQQPVPVPGSSGCRWGCIAVLVTMFAVVVLIGAVLLSLVSSGANAFGGLGNTLGNLLGSWSNQYGPSRVIVLPQVERLQKLSRVTTVKFNYAGVVTVRQDLPPLLEGLYGNKKVLVAVVSVQAGIDLSTLTADNYVYDEATNTLTLTLPAPAIQECFMDDSKSYVVENSTGVFVGSSTTLDNEARRYAIQQFRDQAREENILQEAQTEAQAVITDFISALNPTGGPTIQLNFAAPDPNAPLPPTCQ